MEELIFILIFIGFIGLSYLAHISQTKRNLMGGNFLSESKSTTNLIHSLEDKELSDQEKRLMTNARYRILKLALRNEIDAIKAMTQEELVKIIPSGSSQRVIESPDFKILIKFLAEFGTSGNSSIKVTVQPKKRLGFIFALEEWIDIKQ